MENVDPLIGKTIGNYQIHKLLGKGGMGAVYEVEHTLIGKKAALKLLLSDFAKNPAAAERFFTEAKAVNKIRHQNIVDITDYGKAKEGPYFIMEFLEGRGLNKVVRESGAMELRRAFHIIKQISSALKASHAAGIIHRDLKPENIFLIQMGPDPDFVKVFDFGVAKLIKDSESIKRRAVTQNGAMLGTPSYMAPEQLLDGKGDHRADIYALGLIFYEMLVGYRIVDAANPADIMVKVATEEVPPPSKLLPQLSEQFQALLAKATKKNPAERFQDMNEFYNALQDAENVAIERGELIPAVIDYQTFERLAVVRASQMNLPVITAAEVARAQAQEQAQEQEKAKAEESAQNQGAPIPDQEATISSQETPTPAMVDASTTLSLAAGSVVSAKPAKAYPMAFGAAFAAMVLLGFGWTLFQTPSTKTEVAPPPSTIAVNPAGLQPEPAPISKVKIEFITDPPGATITKGKAVVGKTPYTLELDPSDVEQSVRFTRKGFLPETKTFTTLTDQTFEVLLIAEKKAEKKVEKTPEKTSEKTLEKKCRLKILGGCP